MIPCVGLQRHRSRLGRAQKALPAWDHRRLGQRSLGRAAASVGAWNAVKGYRFVVCRGRLTTAGKAALVDGQAVVELVGLGRVPLAEATLIPDVSVASLVRCLWCGKGRGKPCVQRDVPGELERAAWWGPSCPAHSHRVHRAAHLCHAAPEAAAAALAKLGGLVLLTGLEVLCKR